MVFYWHSLWNYIFYDDFGGVVEIRLKMLFKPKHKEMILNGTKTATRRVWKKPMVKVGGIYKCKLKMLSKKSFAKIKVIKLYKQRLYEMTSEDTKKEGYNNLKEFEKIWIEINGNWNNRLTGHWNGNLVVDVIEFELLKQSKEKKDENQN